MYLTRPVVILICYSFKIAVKNNSVSTLKANNEELNTKTDDTPQYQLQDYVLPSSKSTNCFLNYKTNPNATANWHSDTNLYFRYKKEQECVDSIDDNSDVDDDDDDDDGVDDDELLFSDHAGLFKSLTQNLEENNLNSSSIYNEDDEDFKKKLNYLLSPNDHYKICRLSNDNLNNYDFDSINNWSMRFSGEFNGSNNLAAFNQQQQQQQQQQLQRQITTSNRTTSYSSSQSQTTTSWNKLKSSKSNQHLQSSSSATTTASSSIHNATTTPPLIKLYQSTRSHQRYLITSQTTKSLGNSSSGAAIMTDDEKRARKKLLSKSPTITFGELKQRNRLSSNSSSSCNAPVSRQKQQQTSTIGTQYPPYLMDQSIQTSMFNEKKPSYHKVNACLQATEDDILKEQQKTSRNKKEPKNIKFFYKSLPDLTFLNEYDEMKVKKKQPRIQEEKQTSTTTTTVITQTTSDANDMKLLLSSSSIDKQRKTLKSIKRYRQTKQNTEPCGPIPVAVAPSMRKQVLRSSESFTVKTSTGAKVATVAQNSTNSSSSSSSSGYVSADKIANMQTTTMATIKSLTRQCDSQQQTTPSLVEQQTAIKTQQQLKSCLKRKDSASISNSSSNSYEATTTPQPVTPTPPKRISTIRRHNSTATSTGIERNRLNTNFKILFENDEITSSIRDDALNAMPVFVQNIGWLFTCNLKSLQNYSYYKKLNKSASTLAQKCVLTIDTNKIDIVQEEEGEGGENNDEEEEQENEIVEEDEEEEEEDLDEDEADGTSPFIRLRHECGIRNARSDNDLRNKKCVSFSECISQHTITPPTSQASPIHEQQNQYLHLVSKTSTPLHYSALLEMLKTTKKTSDSEETKYKIQKHDSIEKLKQLKLVKKMNNNRYIDADQISLGSLTESPPNEFKFSEEDEDEPRSPKSNNEKLDLTNYFTSPQQLKLMNELKNVVFQFNDIFAKEQVFISSAAQWKFFLILLFLRN